jgi:hypothetical protein
MKQILLLLAFAALILSSCKSGEDPNPVPTDLISGYLTVARQLDLDSPATKYTEQAWAVFFMHPYVQPSDSVHVAVDSVRLNNIPLTLDNVTKTYKVSGSLKADAICKWQVWSSSNIAAFTYDFGTPYPYYTYKLPDTIDRANSLNITLPGGGDSSTIRLSANKTLQGSYRGAGGGFSSGDMSTLDPGPATLEVSGYIITIKSFGGKNFRFTKQTIKTKPVWLK